MNFNLYIIKDRIDANNKKLLQNPIVFTCLKIPLFPLNKKFTKSIDKTIEIKIIYGIIKIKKFLETLVK